MLSFEILKKEKTGRKNSLNQEIEEWTSLYKIDGYMDMLSGDEAMSTNAFIQESSHVLITWDVEKTITNRDQIQDLSGQLFEITYVDNPMGLGKMYEIYCKKVS